MAFSITAFREAHRPWDFEWGGKTWLGQHVSTPQVQAFEHRLRNAVTEREKEAVHRWLLRCAFPWRFSYLLRGDPVRVLMQLEPKARHAALTDFFASLLGTSPTPQRKTIPGRPSSPPIPTPAR